MDALHVAHPQFAVRSTGCSDYVCALTDLDRETADRFLSRYEHLRNVGLGIWHWGLLIDGALASVLSFGTTCFSHTRGLISSVACRYNARLVQLCRGATASWAPKNTPSKTIGLSLRRIADRFGPTIVVAYADPAFNEIGTIYQASNAIFTGWTNPKGQANYVINGRRLSGWVVRKKFGTRSRERLLEIDKTLVVEPLNPKLRYILIAGPPNIRRKIRKELSTLRCSYPKRREHRVYPMCMGGCGQDL